MKRKENIDAPENEVLERQSSWVQCAGKLAELIEIVESGKSRCRMLQYLTAALSFKKLFTFVNHLMASVKDLYHDFHLSLKSTFRIQH